MFRAFPFYGLAHKITLNFDSKFYEVLDNNNYPKSYVSGYST